MIPDEILNVQQAAELAGCCERTMKEHLRAGRYPGTKPGKQWRVPRNALIKAIADVAVLEAALRREAEQKRRAAASERELGATRPAPAQAQRRRPGRPPRFSYDHIIPDPPHRGT